MRNLTVISKDINEYEKKLKMLAQSKKDSEYNGASLDTSVGVKFCICVAIAVILSYVQFVLMSDSDVIVFAIAALISIIIALASAFKCSYVDISLRVARNFSAIGFAMLLPCVLSLVEFFKYKNETIVFPEGFNGIAFTYSVINKGEFPFFFFNNTVNDALISWWFIVTLGCILPVFEFFLSSVIKCKKEYTKIKESQKKIAEFEERIAEAFEVKKELVKEEKDTKKECAELFEAAQKNDDAECMRQLASLDYSDAKSWCENRKKEQDIKEGEKIYNEEISKENPEQETMIKAANLGCMDACIWVTMNVYLNLLTEYGNGFMTFEEFEWEVKKIQKIAQKASQSTDYNSKSLYLSIDNITYQNFTLTETKRKLNLAREYKKSGKLNEDISRINDANIQTYVERIKKLRDDQSSSSGSTSYGTSNNYSSSSGCSSRWSDGTCHQVSTSWYCSSCPYKGRENECYYSN